MAEQILWGELSLSMFILSFHLSIVFNGKFVSILYHFLGTRLLLRFAGYRLQCRILQCHYHFSLGRGRWRTGGRLHHIGDLWNREWFGCGYRGSDWYQEHHCSRPRRKHAHRWHRTNWRSCRNGGYLSIYNIPLYSREVLAILMQCHTYHEMWIPLQHWWLRKTEDNLFIDPQLWHKDEAFLTISY